MRKMKRRSDRLFGLNTLRSDMGQILKINLSVNEEQAKNSLAPLSGKVQLSLKSSDIEAIFKTNPLEFLNNNNSSSAIAGGTLKMTNAQSQKLMLKKKMTL